MPDQTNPTQGIKKRIDADQLQCSYHPKPTPKPVTPSNPPSTAAQIDHAWKLSTPLPLSYDNGMVLVMDE